jgi:hypothetical protein
MAKAKRDQSELPPMRMMRKGMSLVACDAFSEEMLDGIRFGAAIDVNWTYELMNPKRKKFWAVLSNVIKNCDTPWTNSVAASDALKTHLGVVRESSTVTGAPIHYPASLNDISDEDFESFYHRAMDVLHKITGIDPESLRRNSPKVQDEPTPENQPIGESDLERLNARLDEPLPELDQIVEQNQSDMKDSHLEESPFPPDVQTIDAAAEPAPAAEPKFNAAVVVDFFMKEAIRSPATAEERKAAIALVGEAYRRKFPSHGPYFDTLVHHCGRVAAGQLRAESARSYLVSIAPR